MFSYLVWNYDAHAAIWKLGSVALPLSCRLGWKWDAKAKQPLPIRSTVFSPPNMSDPCGHVIIVRDGWNIQHVDESPRQEHQRAPVLEHGNGRYQIEKEQHLELGEMSHCRIMCYGQLWRSSPNGNISNVLTVAQTWRYSCSYNWIYYIYNHSFICKLIGSLLYIYVYPLITMNNHC